MFEMMMKSEEERRAMQGKIQELEAKMKEMETKPRTPSVRLLSIQIMKCI